MRRWETCKSGKNIRFTGLFFWILDTSTKSDYTKHKYEIRLTGGNMDQEKKSGTYMSSYLCEFNRIFKEIYKITPKQYRKK